MPPAPPTGTGQGAGFSGGGSASASADPAVSGGTGFASIDPTAPQGPGAAPFAQQGPATSGPGMGWGWQGDRWQRRADRWQRRADRWQQRAEDRREGRSGGLIFGLLLIVVGGLFAWHQIDPSFSTDQVWPLAIVSLGVLLVISSIGFRSRD
jgi:hypothetical protein